MGALGRADTVSARHLRNMLILMRYMEVIL